GPQQVLRSLACERVSLAPAADVAKYAAELGRGTSLTMAAKTTRVVMPQLGESVHEGTISRWLVKPGEKVVEFEPMLEVDTDKVSAEVPSPVSGILREILAQEGQTVQAGAESAVVEVGAYGEVPAPPEAASPEAASPEAV